MSAIQTASAGGQLFTSSGGDGRRGRLTTDRRLLIALDVQLCIQRDGRLDGRDRRAGPSASADTHGRIACRNICL